MIKDIYMPEDSESSSCVLVFSGGQDSTTCLGLAMHHFNKVHCVTFSYGQKHLVEVLRARQIVAMYPEVTLEVIDLTASLGIISNSALIQGDSQKDVSAEHSTKPGLPASFVPNRNATFLTLAHAYAQKVGASTVITGVCETDYSGYPDCRKEFIDLLSETLNSGSQSGIEILTPLMHLTKAETFELAELYNMLETVLHHSHTCYNGSTEFNEWGYGCGTCPACELRAKGYSDFKSCYKANNVL